MSQTRVGVRHWLVGTEPGIRRKALFIGRRPNNYMIGMEVADREALLDSLWVYAAQRRFMLCPRMAGRRFADVGQYFRAAQACSLRSDVAALKLARKSREMNGSPEASDPFLSCERAGER